MPKNRAADHASRMTLKHENKEDKTLQILRNLAPAAELMIHALLSRVFIPLTD